jgi:signal transduction histidine kinase
MMTADSRAQAVQAIEKAMAHLDEALFQLDRVPAYDSSAIGFVAHATNNYLAVNEAALDLLAHALTDHPNPEVRTWIDALRRLAVMIHHTVGRLVHVSPSELPLKLEHVHLPVLMQRACDYYRGNAERKRLTISCQSIGEVPPAWADRVAVSVVADNLLSNAVKFSDQGGTILVEITPGPGGVACSVRDHGPGLSPSDQARLIQRGVSPGSTPTEGEPSTGFGLAISKEFIERMGGKLWSESGPERGTCFSFRLPYHDAGGSRPR